MTETTPVTPDMPDAASAASYADSSIGATLRAAREQKGLSLTDIHARLRISERQVQAIENNDFAILPEPTITRGFIRNYAKFLEIDAEPLLAIYRSQTPSEEHKNISIPSANIPITQSRAPDWKKYIYASVLVLLGAGLWLAYDEKLIPALPDFHLGTSSDGGTSSELGTGTEGAAAHTDNMESLPQVALPAAERAADASSSTESIAMPPEQLAEQATPTPAKPVTPMPEAAKPASAQPAAQALQPAPAAAATSSVAPHKVRLTFSEDSWVSIIDRHGNEIYNKTKRAGSDDEVEGEPPLKVTIGNAAGSQLIYDGKPVDTAPYNRLNVVRITLE